MIKPDLNPLYHHLCRPTHPVIKHLFGDDLGRQVKDLLDQRKATAAVMRSQPRQDYKQQRSYNPYRREKSYAKNTMKQAGWFSKKDQSRSSFPMSGNSERPFLGQHQNPKRGKYKQQTPYTYTPTAANKDKKAFHRKK